MGDLGFALRGGQLLRLDGGSQPVRRLFVPHARRVTAGGGFALRLELRVEARELCGHRGTLRIERDDVGLEPCGLGGGIPDPLLAFHERRLVRERRGPHGELPGEALDHL